MMGKCCLVQGHVGWVRMQSEDTRDNCQWQWPRCIAPVHQLPHDMTLYSFYILTNEPVPVSFDCTFCNAKRRSRSKQCQLELGLLCT